MILYPMDKLLANVTSRYELVNVVAHRARELAGNAEKEHISLEEKPVTMALNEAVVGDLTPAQYQPKPAEEVEVEAEAEVETETETQPAVETDAE